VLDTLEVASRTDAGVSARANALALTSAWSAPMLLRALNGIAREIYFHAATPLEDGERVRAARERWYRYYLAGDRERAERLGRIASLLGDRVDVRSFGRAVPSGEPQLRPLRRIDSASDGERLWLDLRAPSFVWGMVRKIVGALLEVEEGRLAEEKLRAAARGAERLTLPLAPPDALILWEVTYDRPFAWRSSRLTRRQEAHLQEMGRQARLLPALQEALRAPRDSPPTSG
jgi:tRNA pseudouridine(38-40) synthase